MATTGRVLFAASDSLCDYVQGVINTLRAVAASGIVQFEVFESLYTYALGVAITLVAMVTTGMVRLAVFESLYILLAVTNPQRAMATTSVFQFEASDLLYFYAHVVTNMLRALAMTGRFQFEDSGSLCCYAHVVTNTLPSVTTTNLTKSSPAWPNLGPRVGAHQRAGRRRHAAGHAPGCMLQFEVFEWPCYYVQGVIDTRQARATTGMVLFEV